MDPSGVRVGILGATGQVGGVMRRLLAERNFPVTEMRYFASARSAGRTLPWGDIEITVEESTEADYSDLDVVLASAGATASRALAEKIAASGPVVIDNSSAFRMDDRVPLVVPEANADALDDIPIGIVANPNCTTMVLMVAAKPLHDAFGLREMVATSYQAAGGAGQGGMSELIDQARKLVEDADALRLDGLRAEASVDPAAFSKAIAFNVLPHCGTFGDERYTDEEWKLVNESRKILSIASLRVSPTCVRVPVMVGHSLAARLTFRDDVSRAAAVEVLADAPGLVIEDGIGADGEDLAYPTPLGSAGRDEVIVGRIREDLGDPKSLNLFVAGDNLLKGAALNAVQLAELVAAEG